MPKRTDEEIRTDLSRAAQRHRAELLKIDAEHRTTHDAAAGAATRQIAKIGEDARARRQAARAQRDRRRAEAVAAREEAIRKAHGDCEAIFRDADDRCAETVEAINAAQTAQCAPVEAEMRAAHATAEAERQRRRAAAEAAYDRTAAALAAEDEARARTATEAA